MKYRNLTLLYLLLIESLNLIGQTQISNLTYNHDVGKYNLLEVQFDIDNDYENPFDPLEVDISGYFTSPSGTEFKLPGFYYLNIHKENLPSGDSSWPFELLTRESTYNWRLRFTPNETGYWQFYIKIIDTNGNTISTTYKFECKPNSDNGFIRKADSKYMMFDNGTPYFPVGINLPKYSREWWSDKEYGTNQIKDFIDTMKFYNINHFRFEINMFQGVNLYGPDLTENRINYYKYFNQKDAWQIDEIVSYAKANEITLSLVINSWQDFDSTVDYSNKAWKDFNPYNCNVTDSNFFYDLDHPGNCDSVWDFFHENDEALQIQKNLMRYVVARWGHATNISSFIVFDEANSIEAGNSANPRDFLTWIMDWHIPIINYIKEIDPYKHLINSGNSGRSFFKNHDVINLFDFYQGHRYTDMTDSINSNVNFDKLLYNGTTTWLYDSTSMPVLFGEFGYLEGDSMAKYDPNAYGIHSILWSSLFSGSFGTPMYWEFKVMFNKFPNGLKRYKGVGNFTKSMPQFTDRLTPFWYDNSDFRICYLSNNNSTKFYGWLQDNEFRFANLFNNFPNYLLSFDTVDAPDRNSSNKIVLNVGKYGSYLVKWYNTETGEEYEPGNNISISTNGSLQIEVPIPTDLLGGIFADGAFIIQLDCEDEWNNSSLNNNAPQNVRHNSNIITDNFGQPLFIGHNNNVHIMWFNGSYFQDCLLVNKLSCDVRTNSGLAIDKLNRIYYIGQDDKIHRLFWTWETKRWHEEIIAGYTSYSVRHNSNISVGNDFSIFYIGNNKAHVLWLDDGFYKNAVVLPKAADIAVNSELSVDNYSNLYYIGLNDTLMHKLFWRWEEKQWEESIIDPNHKTYMRNYSPIRINNEDDRIYYFGLDNKIHEKRKENGNYVDAVIAKNDNYLVQANSGLEFNSQGGLFFTSNNLIHKAFWHNDWIIEELGLNFPANVDEYLCVNRFNHIFYKDNTDRISVDYYGCNDNYRRFYKKDTRIYETTSSTKNSNILNINTELQHLKSIDVWPNPAKQTINLKFTGYVGEKLMSIYSLQGILVAQKSSFSDRTTINVEKIQHGIYFLNIVNLDNHETKMIVIN